MKNIIICGDRNYNNENQIETIIKKNLDNKKHIIINGGW